MKRKKQKANRPYKSIGVLCILAALVLFALAIRDVLPQWQSRSLNAHLRKQVICEPAADTSGSEDANLSREIDFQALKEINPDIVGWIYIPGTQVDYPVLKGEDFTYYLSHTYEGHSNQAGSIFTRPDAREDLQDRHLFFFGHRLASGQMFGQLSAYESQSYANEHPIYLYTPKESRKYLAYAAYQCGKNDGTYQLADKASVQTYLELVKKKALYFDAGTLEQADDPTFLTLSTCPARHSDRYRFVVQCVLMHRECARREGADIRGCPIGIRADTRRGTNARIR